MAQSKDKMVLLTLNTHSWQEGDNASCLLHAQEAIQLEQPDVIALQEVNQNETAEQASDARLANSGYVPGNDTIGADNWALCLAERLRDYAWTWTFAHMGYRTWKEGLAVMSRKPILEVRSADLSAAGIDLRRKAVAIRNADGWFCSVHMGWWNDPQDPFSEQWKKLNSFARSLKGPCWLLGDFNSPAHVRGEGYDHILADGWQDCFTRAQKRDSGVTVPGQIDGWRDRPVEGFRLDLCLAAQVGRTLQSRVIFNDSFYPRVSDHFGVLTWEEKP